MASNAVLKLGAQLTAGTTGNTQGSSQDFISGDGQCFAIQIVGTGTGTSPTVAGKIVESTDGTTWTDVSSGAFTTATTAGGSYPVQVITFQRTKRYLAYYSANAGTGTLAIPITAILGEQIKYLA